MTDKLRTRLVRTALDWQRHYGVAPSITSALAEYDAALLVGLDPREYGDQMQPRTAVSKGFDFTHRGKRYQVKSSRPSGKPGSKVTLVSKPRNYDWDFLIWVHYLQDYELAEAWLWPVDSFRQRFAQKSRLAPEDLRNGRCLYRRRSPA